MLLKRPTREDAKIFLMLLQTFNTPQQHEAGTWFMKEFSAKDYKEFKSKYPQGSKEYGYVGEILGSLEAAGVLVSQGLLNENLYFDASGIGFIWEKLGPIVSGWQKETSPALWENAVWLAQRQREWSKKVWKPNQKWKMKP